MAKLSERRKLKRIELEEAIDVFVGWAMVRCNEERLYATFTFSNGWHLNIHDFTRENHSELIVQDILVESEKALRANASYWNYHLPSNPEKLREKLEGHIKAALDARSKRTDLYRAHREATVGDHRLELLDRAYRKGLDSTPIFLAIAAATTIDELTEFESVLDRSVVAQIEVPRSLYS